MFKVTFTGTAFNPDTEDTVTGWLDPVWNMHQLHENAGDVRSWEFPTEAAALEFIEAQIGPVDRNDVTRGTYYGENSDMDFESGESWSYAAHIEELTRTLADCEGH